MYKPFRHREQREQAQRWMGTGRVQGAAGKLRQARQPAELGKFALDAVF